MNFNLKMENTALSLPFFRLLVLKFYNKNIHIASDGFHRAFRRKLTLSTQKLLAASQHTHSIDEKKRDS